jgi:hypothetical protein
MTTKPTAPLEETVRDAVYIAVGFSVLGVQRLAVLRREMQRDIERRLGTPLTLPALAARAASMTQPDRGQR